jgi:hypothetical protein
LRKRPHSFRKSLVEASRWETKMTGEFDDIIVRGALRLAAKAGRRDGVAMVRGTPRPASRDEQRDGIDIVVELNNATFDVKFRDYRYYLRGILIETVSVVEENVPGWFYTSKADAIVYLWWDPTHTRLMPTGYYIYIQDKKLRSWFEKNKASYGPILATTKKDGKTYHTEFYIVPIEDFPEGTIRELHVEQVSLTD